MDSGQSDFVASAVDVDSGTGLGIKLVSSATVGEGAITLITTAGIQGDITKAVPAGAGEQTGTTAANKGSVDSGVNVHAFVEGNASIALGGGNTNTFAHLPTNFGGAVVFPSLRLTELNSNSNGKNYPFNFLFMELDIIEEQQQEEMILI